MLAKKLRFSLRTQRDFFDTAQALHFPGYSLFLKRQALSPAQGAVIVSKKNFPLAVDRNQVKRQIRALLSPLLVQSSNHVVVVHVKKKLSKEELETLTQKVIRELSR